jgi:uncharacterized protein involved in tellurium resistance
VPWGAGRGAGGRAQAQGPALLVAEPLAAAGAPLPMPAGAHARPGAGGGPHGAALAVDPEALPEGGGVRVVLRGAAARGRLRLEAAGEDIADADLQGGWGSGDFVVGEIASHAGDWHFRPVLRPAGARPAAMVLDSGLPVASLGLQGALGGLLRAVPHWRTAPRAQPPARPDLGALYELADGTRGVVQALGDSYGRLDAPPHMELVRDRRKGEHLALDLVRAGAFRRVLLFASAYGDQGLRGLDGSVTLHSEHGADIGIGLAPCREPATACALALITRDGPDLVVRREARYLPVRAGLSPQRTLDYAYGWGLSWAPGR